MTGLKIHGQLTKETYNQIKEGAVSEFPLESDFIKTPGGFISADEILVLIYQEFGNKPFNIIIEPTDKEPVINRLLTEFVSDQLRKR